MIPRPRPLCSASLPTLCQHSVGAAKGDLADVELAHDPRAAVTVMAVSGGYPGSYPKGKLIEGLDSIDTDATVAFHAGTTRNAEGNLVTSGGRVIAFQ